MQANRKKIAGLLYPVAVFCAVALILNGCSCDQACDKSCDKKAPCNITARYMNQWGECEIPEDMRPPNDAAYDAMFFKNYGVNPFIDTDDDNLSTFAIDTDTGSYTVCRNYLNRGSLPPDEAVRVEEFVNYFDYDYTSPDDKAFAIHLEGAPSKFGLNDKYYLLRVGIKGREISAAERKPANLTFVIDVSGSMQREDRLGLVKKTLRLLVEQLRPSDQIAIVIYGSTARVVLDPSDVESRSSKKRVLEAIDSLQPSGCTNAEQGITLGYDVAEKMFGENEINRVILCSDGVANVGNTGPDSIFEQIKKQTKKGIFLSAIGFGMGNYNDVLLEQLGDKGNGHYAYVDTLDEARRVFVENLTGTLQVIAKDVKIQVDFNKNVVARYRLLGYENRDVADEDFRDDKVDGGEIGSGHSVTALYEIKFVAKPQKGPVATLRVRYKQPNEDVAQEVAREITVHDFAPSFDKATPQFQLAAAVAEFAEVARKSYWAQGSSYADVLKALTRIGSNDKDVAELCELVRKAEKLNSEPVEKYEPCKGSGEE